MDNLLDKTGVKRLLSNIKEYISNSYTNNENFNITINSLNKEIQTIDNKVNELYDIKNLLAYGVEWDITQDDPDCKRIGNLELHKTLPITSGFKKCLFDIDNNKVYKYIAPEFGAYMYSETGEDITSDDYNNYVVKVDTGSDFYLHSEEDGNKRRVWVSQIQIDSSWQKIKRCFIDLARSTKKDNIIGGFITNPFGDEKIYPLERTIINNNTRAMVKNGHFLDYNTYKAIFYWLPVIEYATFNLQQNFNPNRTTEGYLQGGLGEGVVVNNAFSNNRSPIVYSGHSIGDISEFDYNGSDNYLIKYVNNTTTYNYCCWRWFEQIFGDIWTALDGILIYNNFIYIYDDYNKFDDIINEDYNEIINFTNNIGYIGEFILGKNAHIIPKSTGASAITKKCDYSIISSGNNVKLIVGGYAYDQINKDKNGVGRIQTTSLGTGENGSFSGFRTVHYID